MDLSNIHKLVFPIGRITTGGVKLLGTGFIINKEGLVATSAHVVNNDDRNLVVVFKNSFQNEPLGINSYQDTTDNAVQYANVTISRVDPIHDICLLNLQSDIKSTIRISSTDIVSISDELFILGYPHCNNGRMVLTCQETMVGAKILIGSAGIKAKHIVLNIQTRPGQSGSPVFNKKDSSLVAMIIGSYAPSASGEISLGGVDPRTLHQTTHAISAEYLNQLLK